MIKQYDLIRGTLQMEKAIIDGKPGSMDTDNGFINLHTPYAGTM